MHWLWNKRTKKSGPWWCRVDMDQQHGTTRPCFHLDDHHHLGTTAQNRSYWFRDLLRVRSRIAGARALCFPVVFRSDISILEERTLLASAGAAAKAPCLSAAALGATARWLARWRWWSPRSRSSRTTASTIDDGRSVPSNKAWASAPAEPVTVTVTVAARL